MERACTPASSACSNGLHSRIPLDSPVTETSVSAAMSSLLFSVPNASDVRLRITFQYGENMTNCLEAFSTSDVARSVSHLSVAAPKNLDPAFFVDFLGLFPNVRSLEVEIPSFISMVEAIHDDSSLRLQELRLLTVHNKPAYHTALVETCGDRLTTRKEQVMVRSGTGMSIRYLDDYEAVAVE